VTSLATVCLLQCSSLHKTNHQWQSQQSANKKAEPRGPSFHLTHHIDVEIATKMFVGVFTFQNNKETGEMGNVSRLIVGW
jgi:hypothetical protein